MANNDPDYQRRYYEQNKERLLAKARERHAALKSDPVYQAMRSAQQSAHYERRGRARKQQRAYGITPEEYDALLKKQYGRCAICGTDKPGGRGNRFHVDHDHVTGRIRGLLCTRHNVMLGHAQDDVAVLQKAIEYLRRTT